MINYQSVHKMIIWVFGGDFGLVLPLSMSELQCESLGTPELVQVSEIGGSTWVWGSLGPQNSPERYPWVAVSNWNKSKLHTETTKPNSYGNKAVRLNCIENKLQRRKTGEKVKSDA